MVSKSATCPSFCHSYWNLLHRFTQISTIEIKKKTEQTKNRKIKCLLIEHALPQIENGLHTWIGKSLYI